MQIPTSFTSDSHHRRTPTPPPPPLYLDDFDDDNEDEEIMKEKLQAQKEITIAACMDTHLVALRLNTKASTASFFSDIPHNCKILFFELVKMFHWLTYYWATTRLN
jgi:hypothetical protein